MTESQKVQLRLPAPLAEWVRARHELRADLAPFARQVVSDLWTLRSVLAEDLRRTEWTLPEVAEIANALNGALPDAGVPVGVGSCYAAVYDLYRDGSPAAVDQERIDALLDKLGRLSASADMALTDAVASWWRDGGEHSRDGWAPYGVRITTS